MRRSPNNLAAAILFAALLPIAQAPPAAAADQPAISVIPMPASVSLRPGQVTISNGTQVFYDRADAPEARIAAYFVQEIKCIPGITLIARAVGGNANPAGAILLRRLSDAPQTGPESYSIVIAPSGVTISAGRTEGLFYGAVTLAELMTQKPGRARNVVLPAMRIEDAPRFAWRGLMLDSARHFQSVATVKALIDAMALHKLNILQWHLTDDQGWRIEIRKYPKLTQIGAWRVRAGTDLHDIDRKMHKTRMYGGFYTQAQIRDVVAYAKARAITIVPEIEMPGHAMAAIVAYPQLSSAEGVPSRVTGDWGILPYLYNPNDRSIGFLEDVLTEVMALFPGPYIHIGGDEAVKDQWKANPQIQAQMKSLGIANEDALQSWFVSRIGTFLANHGRKMVGWDEILQGGIPPDATIMSWRGIDGAMTAAKAGHDTVLSPAPILYFDNRQGTGTDEPSGRGTLVTLEDVYAFDPEPAKLSADERGHVLGLQANIWTEHIHPDAQVAYMAFPRAAAVAELGWSPSASHDWSGFRNRMVAEIARYRALGIGFAPSAFEVEPSATFARDRSTALVSLSTQAGGSDIRFTTDGNAPNANSRLYSAPFTVNLPANLQAVAFMDSQRLTAPSVRALTTLSLLHRDSRELKLCSNNLALALATGQPPTGKPGVVLVDILNPCWIDERVDLDGIAALEADVGQLPFNFSIGTDRDEIPLRPPHTPQGELEVHLDSCDGALLADLPLAPAARQSAVTELTAKLVPQSGIHDLCFVFTRSAVDPIWALDGVQLLPAAPR
jgi:hexosaminidase